MVTTAESKLAIQSLCSGMDNKVVQEFLARMDDDYFDAFSPEEICTHIRMSCDLDSSRPVQVRVEPRAGGELEILIVGFDYLAEFSMFCGLLSAFGLDIRSGNVYSFSKQANEKSRRRIVDVFRVGIREGEIFDSDRQREFEEQLRTLAQLLAAGSIDEARERLNRALTERIEKINDPLTGLASRVDIRFDNHTSRDWTVIETRSEDTFAFLYGISNALAMRGIYIHKVRIGSSLNEAVDQFFIADRWGRKIEDPREQERLRVAVEMLKQFTRFLPQAPDPAKAMRHFDQLLDKLAQEEFPDHTMAFLAREEGMNMLAHLLGSSDFLWDEFLQRHFAELFPILEDFPKMQLSSRDVVAQRLRAAVDAVSTLEGKKSALNRFKDDQLFLIDVKHLLDSNVSLSEFSQKLTELAEVVIAEALRISCEQAGTPPGLFAICGLGKFGGREMGYASDLELLFVHEAPGNAPFFESLARSVTDLIESRSKGIFHVDLRLRPFGEKGASSTAFDQFAKYYSADGPAAPFERQAFIRLRWIAGDEELGRRIEAHRDTFTYSDVPWDWQNALHLRRRQMRELVKPGQINVKYSPGGIVDIEYAVQYLQLLNGREHPEIRVPNTLEALDRLRRLQIVREPDYAVLHTSYQFLRNLIDALRMVRGDASDLELPAQNSEEFKSLARRLGYREQERAQGAARLAADIELRMKKVHEYFLNRFSSQE